MGSVARYTVCSLYAAIGFQLLVHCEAKLSAKDVHFSGLFNISLRPLLASAEG